MHHCDARDILSLLSACLDRPFQPIKPAPFQILGPIAQVRRKLKPYEELSDYILLLERRQPFMATISPSVDSVNSAPSSRAAVLEDRIIDFCISGLEKTKSRLKDTSQNTVQAITSGMWRHLTNFCIVTEALSASCQPSHRRIAELEVAAETFARSIAQSITKLSHKDQYKVDAVLETCALGLPDIKNVETLSKSVYKNAGMLSLAVHLSKAVDERRDSRQSFTYEENDFMDIDDGPDSQLTNGVSRHEVDVPRHNIQALSEPAALHACCSAYLHLISSTADMVEEEHGSVPSGFIAHLTSLPEAELLRSRQFVQALLRSDCIIAPADCLNILERLVEALLDPAAREYNTSEVANCMMVESLIGMTRVWNVNVNDRESNDVKEQVKALYGYFTKDMEKSGVRRSPVLQLRVADFLYSMLKHYADISEHAKMPSVRTTLFGLLAQGEMTVRHHIAESLPTVFEIWALNKHDEILQDIDSSLPGDNEGLEGIAIRLLVLSKLASRWHTLLRQCVYRIFETAGLVAGAAEHAVTVSLELHKLETSVNREVCSGCLLRR